MYRSWDVLATRWCTCLLMIQSDTIADWYFFCVPKICRWVSDIKTVVVIRSCLLEPHSFSASVAPWGQCCVLASWYIHGYFPYFEIVALFWGVSVKCIYIASVRELQLRCFQCSIVILGVVVWMFQQSAVWNACPCSKHHSAFVSFSLGYGRFLRKVIIIMML